jgi:heme-degrading monooxygenase HmoA
MLRRDDGDRTEFITLSLWDSVDAIRAFAGHDIDAAVLQARRRPRPPGWKDSRSGHAGRGLRVRHRR